MGIGQYVAVSASLSEAKVVTVPGFSTPLLLAFLSAAAVTANPAVFRLYDAGSALEDLVADGILTTDPVYRAFEVALAAPNAPAQIALGRRRNAPAQVLHVTFTDTAVGDALPLTVVGSDGVSHAYTITSSGTPATDAATMAAAITASNVGTVTASTSVLTFTQSGGKLTDLQDWHPTMQVADATADPGIAADIAAVLAANAIGWYSLSLDSNSSAQIQGAQASVEATGQGGQVGFYDTPDYANGTSSGTDVFSHLESESYSRCYVQDSQKSVLSYAGFGLAAQILGLPIGSYALSYKSIPGVQVDNDQSLNATQRNYINTASTSAPGTGGKNGNYYVVTSGINMTFPGVAPSGTYLDQTILLDWVKVNIQASLLAVVAGLPKLPIDDNGIGLAGDAMLSVLRTLEGQPHNGIVPGSSAVTKPKAADLSVQDRNDRNLEGLGATAKLTGAVNTFGGGTALQVVVTP